MLRGLSSYKWKSSTQETQDWQVLEDIINQRIHYYFLFYENR